MKELRYVALMSLSLSLNAFALRLGELKVHSNLDQPFDAEIELIDVGNLPLSAIKASMASDGDYDQVGFKRKFTGDDLAFVIEKNSQDQPVITVRSINPISDPFIQVLIDVAWANGQAYRAYSVLLDPPDYQLTLHRSQVSPIYPQTSYSKVTPEQQVPVTERTVKALSAHLPTAVGSLPQGFGRYQSAIPSVPVLSRFSANNSFSFSQPQSLLSAVEDTSAPLPSRLPVHEAANSPINAQIDLTASVVTPVRESNDPLKDQLSEIRAKNQALQHHLQQRNETIATLRQQLSVLIRQQGAGGQVVSSHESNQWLWLFVLLGLVAGGSYIPKFFQKAIFGLLLFAQVTLKKIRNRAGYSSFFSTPPTQKSSRPKPSILKDIGYTQPAEKPVRSYMALKTVLKLAVTYIEMNDIEAARQSLTEVMLHGNAKQKALAKKLFNQIA